LFAADHLDAVLDNFLILVNAALLPGAIAGAGKLLVNLQFVARLGLLGDEVHNALDFLVGNVRALGPGQLG